MAQRSVAECNAALGARNTLANGGSVEIRSGAPADIDSAATGSVLVTFPLGNPAFGAASNRTSSLNLPAAVTASADGTGAPYHYVLKDSGGNVLRNGTAGTSGTGGTDMILSAATWSTGDDVEITAWTTSEGKGSN